MDFNRGEGPCYFYSLTFVFSYIIISLEDSLSGEWREICNMNVTYIHHSCFLVETERCYFLFDYEKGSLPQMNAAKPIFVLSSHSHGDHYNPKVFSLLADLGMQKVQAVLSDDIEIPENVNTRQVSPEEEYDLGVQLKLTTFRSTDLGVAFLVEDGDQRIYHAGDLNDWVWEEETENDNRKMTADYRRQIKRLSEVLGHRELDVAFVVLDPRQEKDYDRGLCFFLENIPVKQVYPMHYWENPAIINTFLKDHPEYKLKIQRTE